MQQAPSHNTNKCRHGPSGAYTGDMKTLCAFAAVSLLCCASFATAQEKPLPKDSRRITVPGCVRGSTFITATPKSHETTTAVKDGQRYRLNASKNVLKDMEKQKATMVEVTGLVLMSQMDPGGVSIAGGRIRIGGAMPRDPRGMDVSRDPRYNQVVLDVESWHPLPDACQLK